MRFIKEYIEEQLITYESKDLAPRLGVSISMLSSYKRQGYNPSITVAKAVYTLDKVVLHPFSEESLQFEINKG